MTFTTKKLMGVVEHVMGKPYKKKPNIYSWSAKNIFRTLYAEARTLNLGEGTMETALWWTEQFIESKVPFTLENNDTVVLCTEELHSSVQALMNIHELTHAYANQHWPGQLTSVKELFGKQISVAELERVFVEKTLDEGLAEYVSLRTQNPIARQREKDLKERIKGTTPREIVAQINKDLRENEHALTTHDSSYYLLGYGLLETAMLHNEDVWDTFDILVNNPPSLKAIGEFIEPLVYEVKK